MHTIYKYEVRITDTQQIYMPLGAKLLTVQVQRGKLMLWAEVDTEARSAPRTIEVSGTGNPLPEGHRRHYIGTAQTQEGYLVWHVFERLPA